MLKHPKDAYLILLAALNVALITAMAAITPWALGHLHPVSVVLLAAVSGLAILFLYLTNYQCVSHYHIHIPYFRSRALNDVFSIFNSLALGVPQTLYHVHHLYHHKGNNDRRDPATGTTIDFASSYRYSKDPDVEEGFVSFSLKGPIRAEILPLVREGIRLRRTTQIALEFVALGLFWLLLAWLSWRNFAFFYLPLWFLGQVLNYAENYLEHSGASHLSRLDNSVSCYNRFYNWIWFNNGYHQEHHYRPGVHWSQLPKVRSLMLEDSKRRIVPYCHVFNLPWIQRRKAAAAAREHATT
jgi:fatty acid desaturase